MSRPTTQTHGGGSDAPAWIEPMIAAGEVRLDWHFSRSTWNKAGRLAMGLGAWGIITGYALFLLLWHERHHPWKFVVALLFAAVASFIVESTRGLILGHKPEKLNGPRLIITILTLAIVELFIVAVHSIAIPSAASFAEVQHVVFGEIVAKHVPVAVTLVSLVAIWVVVGALLAGGLMFIVPETTGSPRTRILKSAGFSAIVGAVVAPLALLAAVLVIRIVGVVAILFTAPREWADHLRALREIHPVLGAFMWPLEKLGDLWSWHPLGALPVGPVLTIAVVLVGLSAAKDRKLGGWMLLILAVILIPVLFRGFFPLLGLLGLTGLVWLLPSAAIGALAPALRRPSEDTRTWGLVAFLGGSLLTVLTFVRLTSWWFLLPASLLYFTWLVLRGGARLNDYWPLVGLTAALVVSGFTWAGQMTFAGVFTRFHAVNDGPLLLTPESRPAVSDSTQLQFLEWLRRRDADPATIWSTGLEPQRFMGSQSTALVRALGGAATRPTRASDAELDALAKPPIFFIASGAASETNSIHGEWTVIRLGAAKVDDKVAAKRALVAKVAKRRAEAPQLSSFGGGRDAAYLQALQARLQWDLGEADAALALERDWSDAAARGADPSIEAAVAIRDRAQKFRASANSGEAEVIVDRLVAVVDAAMPRIETHAIMCAASGLPKLDAMPGRDRLPLLQKALKGAGASTWRTDEARALAGRITADLARAVTTLEAETVTELDGARAGLENLEDAESRYKTSDALATTARGLASEWSTDAGRGRLTEIAERADAVARAAQTDYRAESRRYLELCLCGSLGFWVSVGMLAGFSLLRSRGRVVKGNDGKARCFWGDAGAMRTYHDLEHGVAPASDRELFRRLSMEILAPTRERAVDLTQFADFDPAKLAARPLPPEVAGGAREACDRRATPAGTTPAACKPEGVSLVLENARRLQDWYAATAKARALATVPDASETLFLDDLRSRAGQPSGAEAVVFHASQFFCLRKTTPIATFLQSVAILPGAHFHGCEFSSR